MAGADEWLQRLHHFQGIDLTENAHLKLLHEAQELADDLTLEEWADVAICLMAVAVGQRWSHSDLAQAVDAKVLKNMARTWEKQPDGTFQHAADSGRST